SPRAVRARTAGRHRARTCDRERTDARDGWQRRRREPRRRAYGLHCPARHAGRHARDAHGVIDVEAARERIAGRVVRTPTLQADGAGGVWLKAELFQKTGSFKARGALSRILTLSEEEKRRGVVTWSAGNHAQAVAWAAREEGVDCVVEMWETASAFKIERSRGFGATVDLSPPDPSAAYDRALELVEREGRVFVHPHSD